MGNNTFKGLIASPYTAFQKDYSLNLSIIPQYQKFLKKNGAKGAFIASTTGEGLSLTPAEHFHLTKAWVDASDDDFKITVSVGADSIAQSQNYARQASMIGADAIAILLPGYYQPNNIRALIDSFLAIAKTVPDIPVYYYHIPSYTGIEFPVNQFLQALVTAAPNFAGVKFSSKDFVDFQICCSHWAEHLDIFSGFDESLIHGILAGSNGAVGSTFNYMTPLYVQIVRAMDQGNIYRARSYQDRAVQVIDLMEKFGGLHIAGKTILSKVSGIDFGPFRLPLVALDFVQERELLKKLEKIGFFEFSSMP